MRCDRELPCSNCVRANRESCVYDKSDHLHTSTQPPASEGVLPQTERPYFESPFASAFRPLQDSTAKEDVSNLATGSDRATNSSYTTQPSSSNTPTPLSQPSATSLDITADQRGNTVPPSVPVLPPVVIENYNTGPSTSAVAELCNERDREDLFGRPQVRGRLVIHKSRLFGQSHWMNGCDSVSSYTPYHPTP